MVDATTNVIIGEETGTINMKTTSTPVTPDAGNVKVFVDSADDDVKQVDSTGTVTALGGGLSSPVGISDGGTGQTAKAAAFDALSPMTTRGDMNAFGVSDAERLAVGTANQYLISDGTDPEWRTPPRDEYTVNEGSDYTTSSTSFVDVDVTNLALTITTNGGDVLVGFHGHFSQATSGQVFLDIHESVAAGRIAGDDGIIRSTTFGQANQGPISFVRQVTGLTAASHTFKMQWKVTSGTATLSAGAGTAQKDVHPQFWVLEI